MRIVTVKPEAFGSNTYLLVSGDEALVIDPSISVSAITAAADREKVRLTGILLTHGHFDHIISLDTLRDATGINACIHKNDAEMLSDGKKNAFYTFFGRDRAYRPAERLLSDGDVISVGDEKITVIHTPGHTGGSVCFICGDILVTGDTLFAQGYGRCDLWSGDISLMRSSLGCLREFERNITIYPGHGQPTKLGDALDEVAFLI